MKKNYIKIFNTFNVRISKSSFIIIFGLLIFIILLAELFIMLAFEYLDSNNHLVNAFIDSLILIIIIAPFLYYLIYKPSLNYLSDYQTTSEKINESLLKRDAKHRSMIANISDVIGIIGTDGIMRYKSPNIYKWFGWQPQDIIGTDGWLTVHPDDLERIQKDFITLIKKENASKTVQYRFKCKDGNYKPIELTATNLSNDPIIEGVLLNYHDITARKLAEELLQKLSMAISNSKEVVFLTDLDGIFTFINPEFTKMYGFTYKETVGICTPRILNSGIYEKKQSKFFWDTLLDKEAIPATEYQNKCKDGKLIDVEGSADPILNDNGNIIGFLGIQRDITNRKKSQKVIHDTNKQLSKINNEKDKFFSIIAHDLRNPFNRFLGLTQFMDEELPHLTSDEIKDIILKMRISANELYKLLQNLLQWSTIQQGLIPFSQEKFSLYSVVNESLNTISTTAKNKKIEILSDIPDDIEVYADVNMLQTIIRNLISNAIKYTTEGGKIIISAKVITGGKIQILVKDSGIGMHPTLLNNLFNIDVQTNRMGTNDEPSSGLGLILCKEFVDKHNGEIWAESKENKGSTFYFTIPQKEVDLA